MNTQVKSALLLAVTLALGVILGMTGRGALEQQQARGMEGGRPRGLVGHMEQTIQPRDSAQAAAIRPVLLRAAERNRRIIANVNDALRASIDTMKMELAPLIDDAQRARLEEVTRTLPPVRGPGGGPPFGRGGGFGPPGMGGRRGPPPGPPPENP